MQEVNDHEHVADPESSAAGLLGYHWSQAATDMIVSSLHRYSTVQYSTVQYSTVQYSTVEPAQGGPAQAHPPQPAGRGLLRGGRGADQTHAVQQDELPEENHEHQMQT